MKFDRLLKLITQWIPKQLESFSSRFSLLKNKKLEEIVEIKNTSVLTSEQLIQRLYFIPLVSDNIDDYTIFNECKCLKNCEKCSIPFTIDVKNNTKENTVVYSDSIQIENSIVKVFKETK